MVIVIGRLRGHNRSCRHRCRRPLGARAHPGRRRALLAECRFPAPCPPASWPGRTPGMDRM